MVFTAELIRQVDDSTSRWYLWLQTQQIKQIKIVIFRPGDVSHTALTARPVAVVTVLGICFYKALAYLNGPDLGIVPVYFLSTVIWDLAIVVYLGRALVNSLDRVCQSVIMLLGVSGTTLGAGRGENYSYIWAAVNGWI